MALKSKLAQIIMKFGISMLDYPPSTESQLKSEGTLGGLTSSDVFCLQYKMKSKELLKSTFFVKMKMVNNSRFKWIKHYQKEMQDDL